MPDGRKSPNPTDKHVGARVRMRRMMLSMSQEKLGDALGLTFQQVQKYEKGTNRIGASRLQHIAQILQVPVSFFFEGGPAAEGPPRCFHSRRRQPTCPTFWRPVMAWRWPRHLWPSKTKSSGAASSHSSRRSSAIADDVPPQPDRPSPRLPTLVSATSHTFATSLPGLTRQSMMKRRAFRRKICSVDQRAHGIRGQARP